MDQNLFCCHRNSKCFLATQDPFLTKPHHKACNNSKVIPFLIHLSEVIKEAWEIGQNLAVGKHTIGFQGQHADELRINFKNNGDGFQAGCFCKYGYTLSFYFWNEPPLQHCIDKELYPLHACVIGLIDYVTELHHPIGMDNLYTSVKFTKAWLNNPKKVLIHGVIRKGICGVPNWFVQEEHEMMKRQEDQRGNMKSDILVGDSSFPNMIFTSVYDTKPVHFI